MQLFTIGLWELNMDGTQKKDKNGLGIGTYTNDDIMAFSKVWTGYGRQRLRANIAIDGNVDTKPNLIDPMSLNALNRDRFPKTTMGGGHLGDYYPLCSHLPKRHFLRKGSRYRYHGAVSMFGKLHDNFTHFTPDPQKSGLYKQLCARDARTKKCTFRAVVTLVDAVKCNGEVECDADNLRAVKIVDGAFHGFYTYVEPACTRLTFFNDGKVARSYWHIMCADPRIADTIGTACCSAPPVDVCKAQEHYESHHEPNHGDVCRSAPTGSWTCPKGCKKLTWRDAIKGSPHIWEKPFCVTPDSTSEGDMKVCHLDYRAVVDNNKQCKYVAEPLKFATAQARCAKVVKGGVVCPKYYTKTDKDGNADKFRQTCAGIQSDWQDEPCRLQVQVLPSGEVMVVDGKNGLSRLRVNSGNTFRVEWGSTPANASNPFPVPSGKCAEGCYHIAARGGSCVCDAVVSDVAVFPDATKTAPSATDLRAKLLIGAHPPTDFSSSDGYTMCTTKPCLAHDEVRVYTQGTDKSPTALGTSAIFELTQTPHNPQPTRRSPGRYLLNRASTVHIGHHNQYVHFDPEDEKDEKSDYTAAVSSTDECSSSKMTIIPTLRECKLACKLMGQKDEDWEDGYWSTAAGCLIIDPNEAAPTLSRHLKKNNAYCKWNKHKGHTGNPAPEARALCRSKDAVPAIRFSINACKDRDLGAIKDPAECEQAARFIAAETGNTVGRGGIISIGDWGHLPAGCTLFTDSGKVKQKGDFSPHWNTRTYGHLVDHGQDHFFSPVCHHADNGQNKDRKTGFTFRNPPGFMPNLGNSESLPGDDRSKLNPYGDDDHLESFAEFEKDALIDHLLEHDNTPPFVAYRIIQRLVTSNPSPRYVKAVATAFATGSYAGKKYSGKYGDMGALVAGVLLDPEARSSLLQTDPSFGSLREPIIKVLHLLRTLEFKPRNNMDTVLDGMEKKIGQMAHLSPGVFNFYLPEFMPSGVLEDAGLVAPEMQISTAPFVIGFLNGMASLIDYGQSSSLSHPHPPRPF